MPTSEYFGKNDSIPDPFLILPYFPEFFNAPLMAKDNHLPESEANISEN